MIPPTPAQFRALVAALVTELKAAEPGHLDALLSGQAQPAAFRTRPWVNERVDARAAAALCGLSAGKTWPEYTRRAAANRARGESSPRDLPSPDPDGMWDVGTLAIWRALRRTLLLTSQRRADHSEWMPKVAGAIAAGTPARQFAQAHGISRDLARTLYREAGWRSPDETWLPIAAQAVARDPAIRAAGIRKALAGAGHTVSGRTARRLLRAAGGDGMAGMEADTPAGLVRPSTLARAAGVGLNSVSMAMRKCRECSGRPEAAQHGPGGHPFVAWLTPAGEDRWGKLLDPAKVKQVPGMRTPVDADFAYQGRRRRQKTEATQEGT